VGRPLDNNKIVDAAIDEWRHRLIKLDGSDEADLLEMQAKLEDAWEVKQSGCLEKDIKRLEIQRLQAATAGGSRIFGEAADAYLQYLGVARRPSGASSPVTDSALVGKQFDDPKEGFSHGLFLQREAEKSTDPVEAFRHLEAALACFRAVKGRFPDWKKTMVDGQIRKTEEWLGVLPKSGPQ
jgi:hypothetical protein